MVFLGAPKVLSIHIYRSLIIIIIIIIIINTVYAIQANYNLMGAGLSPCGS
jgi:hypothetical protein